ncbi:MAG: HDOD domain-containing protein [Gammaproteobacteria bacterium]|nr:HDOD domain-containing protein [Gammaproteobacteria bacterium]
MTDESGIILAVLPSDRLLDVDALRRRLSREFYPLTASRTQTLFQDCEEQAWPPLAKAYGMRAIVDVSLYSQLVIRFMPGRRNIQIGMSVQEFQRLMGDVALGRFSAPLHGLDAQVHFASLHNSPGEPLAQRIGDAIERCENLPVLPESATEIFKLATDPNAGARDLAKVIELDSALTANILRYANSSFYGHQGEITDVQSAISRVLGFDRVLSLAIGMSIGRSFRILTEGPLGLNAYRRNAVYCAALSQKLAHALPKSNTAHAGTAYAAGLLHDFGRLFVGHVFPREYSLLERSLLANSHASMPDIEHNLMGIGHDEIAARLLQSWQLPETIVAAVRHHHNPSYRGEHALYAKLVLIANCALAKYGLNTSESDHLSPEVLTDLGLTEKCVREAADALWQDCADMETLAQLVA